MLRGHSGINNRSAFTNLDAVGYNYSLGATNCSLIGFVEDGVTATRTVWRTFLVIRDSSNVSIRWHGCGVAGLFILILRTLFRVRYLAGRVLMRLSHPTRHRLAAANRGRCPTSTLYFLISTTFSTTGT